MYNNITAFNIHEYLSIKDEKILERMNYDNSFPGF